MSVYNGEPFLEEAIQSMQKQTFSNFELIIVNDASDDNSLEIMESHAEKDPRLIIIDKKENDGLSKSLIKAIEISRGEYIARQDSDDVSLPRRLEKQVEFLERNPSYGAVGTAATIIDEHGRIIKKPIVIKSWAILKRILNYRNCFFHGSMMFRKKDYLRAGGYRAFISLGQDFDLMLRMSKVSRMKNLNDNLYLWRKTSDSITSTKTDAQYKMGALALYDFRYNNIPDLEDGFDMELFINSLNNEDRKKYYLCLRDLCLGQGNFEMAEDYVANDNTLNRFLIRLSKILFKIIRLNKVEV